MARFQCEEYGEREYLDIEGSGSDEFGDFQDYVCKECGHITRVYDDQLEKKSLCEDCIHKAFFENGDAGCVHFSLYDEDGNIIEAINNQIIDNMICGKCDKKETK